ASRQSWMRACGGVALAAGGRRGRRIDRSRGVAALEAVLFEALPLDDHRRSEWRVWLAFWGKAPADPALIREQRRRYAEWRALVRSLVAAARSRGELRPSVSPDEEADHLIALIDGLGL